ncbi:hypothetical protein H4R19_003311 [Coemansia spiralis]|nr:hypothetical protein H4R19_003311 [Coemansia spiralis]
MSSPTALPLSTSTNGKSRAATAAAVAAAAHQFASMDTTMRPTITSGATNIESYLLKAADVSQSSSSGSDAAAVAAAAETPASGDRQLRPPSARGSSESTDDNGKIRLRTRPLTSMTYETRRRSSPLLSIHGGDCNVSASPKPLGRPGDGDGANGGRGGHQPAGAATPGAASSARRTHARKLSSRKSDSALTTTARSHRRGGGYRDDSSDDNMRSPEFTVLHPDLKRRTNSRRGRFASALLRLLR